MMELKIVKRRTTNCSRCGSLGKRGVDLGEELEVLPHSPLESLMLNSASGGHFVDESEVRRSAVGRVFKT